MPKIPNYDPKLNAYMRSLATHGRDTTKGQSTDRQLKKLLRRYLDHRKEPVMRREESARKYLGCTIKEWFEHIEGTTESGMPWEDYGKSWVITYVEPLEDFNTKEEASLYKAFNYKNTKAAWRSTLRKADNQYAPLGIKCDDGSVVYLEVNRTKV